MISHRYAAKLPGSAPWVLYELLENPVNGIGQLMDALELGHRTIERAVHELQARGLCVMNGHVVTLAQDWREVVAGSVQNLSQGVNTTGTEDVHALHTAGTDDVQNLSQGVYTPGTSLVTELTKTVQHEEKPKSVKSRAPISSSSSSLKVNSKEKTNTKTTGETKIKKSERPRKPRAVESWAALQELPGFVVPPWLDLERWQGWVEDLQERLVDTTVGALREHLLKLKKLLDLGATQDHVFSTAIARKWETLGEVAWFPELSPKAEHRPKNGFQTASKTTPKSEVLDFNDPNQYRRQP